MHDTDEDALRVIGEALDQREPEIALEALSNCSSTILCRFISNLNKALLASTKGRGFLQVPLSSDQTPKLASECLGKAGKPAIPSLMAILKSRDLETHFWALNALESMGSEGRESIPLVLKIIDATSVYEKSASATGRLNMSIAGVPGEAVVALASLVGPGDMNAIPYLVAQLGSENEDVRDAAANGLARIRGSGTS
jgi:HEAT repeat protein